MDASTENNTTPGIAYSCYYKKSREGEQFVADHVLSYQISGTLILNDGSREYTIDEGSFRFIKRNQLLKFAKYPPLNGGFKSLAIHFTQQTLKDVSLALGYSALPNKHNNPVHILAPSPSLTAYFNSLLAYHQNNQFSNNQQLIELKQKEGIFLLMQLNPALKNSLFDFNEPHKIDLEAFMNRNFHFNVHLEKFAYLTGRSLATFKRDFEKQFNTTPGRWLLQKRLNEAYYLIKNKGKLASDIYLDLGFEDLSHFSFAFKKAYGEAPSKIS